MIRLATLRFFIVFSVAAFALALGCGKQNNPPAVGNNPPAAAQPPAPIPQPPVTPAPHIEVLMGLYNYEPAAPKMAVGSKVKIKGRIVRSEGPKLLIHVAELYSGDQPTIQAEHLTFDFVKDATAAKKKYEREEWPTDEVIVEGILAELQPNNYTVILKGYDPRNPPASTPPAPTLAKAKPPMPAPVEPMPEPAAKQSAKSLAAIKALEKLGAYVSPDTWQVSLQFAKDLDKATALLEDLDHIYELKVHEKTTDTQLASLKNVGELRKLELTFNETLTDAGMVILKRTPKLKHLDFYPKAITAKGLAHVAGLKELESLEMRHHPVNEMVAEHIGGLRKLTILEAAYCELTPACLAHFKDLERLRELNLGGNDQLDDESMKHLAGMTALQQLNLGSSKVGNAGLKHLAGFTELARLNLHNTRVDDAGFEHLAGMRKLAFLDVGSTKFKGTGLKHLAGCKELTSLDVQDTPQFTGEGLRHLAGCPKLTSINLSWTGLNDAGLADVKELKQLTGLDLPPYGHKTAILGAFWQDPHPERFSDKGLKHIGEMTQLEWLYISGSGLTDAGLAHLAALKKLETLAFGVLPNIKGPGLEHLKGLPLTRLRLTETGVTDDTLKHIAALTQLEWVILPRGAKPDAALKTLAEMTHLKTIGVPKSWSKEDTAILKKALPKADIYAAD